MTIQKQVAAGASKLGPKEVLKLAGSVRQIFCAKGQKVVAFDMQNPPSRAVLLEHLLGRTGNLRAPTLRIEKQLWVGFNQTLYENIPER